MWQTTRARAPCCRHCRIISKKRVGLEAKRGVRAGGYKRAAPLPCLYLSTLQRRAVSRRCRRGTAQAHQGAITGTGDPCTDYPAGGCCREIAGNAPERCFTGD